MSRRDRVRRVTSAGLLAAMVTPAPTLSYLSFPYGAPAGSNSIVINGANLGSALSATVGSNAAAITGNTSSTVTITVPANATPGDYTVSVTTAGGTATGLRYTYLAGMVARWAYYQNANNGSIVTASLADTIGGLTLAHTGSPTWMTAAVGGLGAVKYNGTSQDSQNTTLVLAQPFALFRVMAQYTSVSFAYVFGGSGPTVLDQQGAGGPPALSLYAGAGPAINQGDLPVGSFFGVVQAVWNNASSSIQIGDGTPLSGTAGTNGLSAGFGTASYVDGTGKSSIGVALDLLVNTGASGYNAARTLAAIQREVEPCPVVYGGTSIEAGYGLTNGATDPWPMQLAATNGNLFQLNPGVTWGPALTTRQVGTPAVSKDFGYPGAPFDGTHPNTPSTINATAASFEDLALAALIYRKRVVLCVGAPTNDLSFGATLANCQTNVAAYITARRAAWAAAGGPPGNLKVILLTCIARTWLTDGFGTAAAKETVRGTYNTDVAANYHTTYGADAYADPAATLNDATDATKYQTPDPGGSNGIHPAFAGAGLIAAAVQVPIIANGWGS